MHRETPTTVGAASAAALRVGGALTPAAGGGGGALAGQPVVIEIYLDKQLLGRASSEWLHGQTTLLARIN
jgi:hypothetical protein